MLCVAVGWIRLQRELKIAARLVKLATVVVDQPQVVVNVRRTLVQRQCLLEYRDGARLLLRAGDLQRAKIGGGQIDPHHDMIGMALPGSLQNLDSLVVAPLQDISAAQIDGRFGAVGQQADRLLQTSRGFLSFAVVQQTGAFSQQLAPATFLVRRGLRLANSDLVSRKRLRRLELCRVQIGLIATVFLAHKLSQECQHKRNGHEAGQR